MLQYGPSLGFQPLREWLAEWQGVTVDRVLTGNGSLQLIEFLCLHMLQPGDTVFTEAPTYDRTLTLLRRHGAKMVGIPVEADGPELAALEQALAKHVPKFFYIIPDFQNPAGATCSGAKRRQIVELAEQHGFLLVEDAPYRLLRYRGTRGADDLRAGTGRHASHELVHQADCARRADRIHDRRAGDRSLRSRRSAEDTYISPGYVAQGITNEWCRRGLLAPQIERLKKLYAPRLDACLAGLDKYMPETRGDAARRRVLHLAHAARRGDRDRGAGGGGAAQGLNLADGSGVLPAGRRRAIPAAAVLRAHAGGDRRGHPASGRQRPVNADGVTS